jgi:hypothetical protein
MNPNMNPKAPRNFFVFTEPSIADPAHVIVIMEVFPDKTHVEYSDTTILEELLLKIRLDSAKRVGHMEGMNEVLSELGMSFEEYRAKRKENANKKSLQSS